MDISFSSFVTLVSFIVIDIGMRLFALWYIPNNRKPSDATAWLVVVFFMPILGVLVFLMLGHSKLSKKRRAKQNSINNLIYKHALKSRLAHQNSHLPAWLIAIGNLNNNLTGLPIIDATSVELISDYKKSLQAMTASINAAQDYVHVEFYIMSLDATSQRFFDSLVQAKKRGVIVRVLLDHVGSLQYPDYKRTLQFLDQNAIEYRVMLPFKPFRARFQRPDLRNHRKLLVVDGTVAFMGSQNIIDSSYNKKANIKLGRHWVELMVRLEGLVVHAVDSVFVGDWYAETDELLETHIASIGKNQHKPLGFSCQVIPSGPGFEEENNLKLFTSLIYAAQHKLIITSPYFVPDESMLTALTTAAQRGVHVELFVSEAGDQFMVYHAQRSYYEALLRAGVRIYLYRSPFVLHAKHFTVDDSVAVIGSSNMDMRSFNLNMEVSLMVYSAAFTKKMRKVEDDYRNNSRELLLNDWLKRPIHTKLIDNVARLTSSLQ